MKIYIDLLKIIAAFLITNSHMDKLYTNNIFSFGGALGNALFFIVAGFCLSERNKNSGFLWVKDRLKRLYTPLWSVLLILILIGDIDLKQVKFFEVFFFPYCSFWFISAIMVDYIILYFVCKYFKNHINTVTIISVLIYFIWYICFLDKSIWNIEGIGFFKYSFYFIVMLIGVRFKFNKEVLEKKIKGKSVFFLLISVISVVAHAGMRLLTIKIPSLLCVQFIVQLFTLSFAVAFFFFMWSLEHYFSKMFTSNFIRLVANSTLEIYLVNMMVINRVGTTWGRMSVPIAFILVFAIGILIHYITGVAISWISQLFSRKL